MFAIYWEKKRTAGEMQAGWEATCLIASLKVFEEMPKIKQVHKFRLSKLKCRAVQQPSPKMKL